jgi:hypothetical protein
MANYDEMIKKLNQAYKLLLDYCTDFKYSFNEEAVIRNMRAVLRLFNVKVLVYTERVEIKGTIPS